VGKASGDSLDVFVDDDAIQVGTTATLIGNTSRTWYDGVSYAKVEAGPDGVAADGPLLPSGFALSQNYPNPFNPTTAIRYQLPGASWVTLKVFDVLGREVATLVGERKLAGSHVVRFDGSSLASGVYVYRLTAEDASTGSVVLTKKLLLLR
jgi:hypothetical protein